MSPQILYLLTNIFINFIGATKTLGDDADRLVGLSRKSSRNNF